MALYKRNDTWHADFSVNGARYRQSLKTPDWREAQAREKELIAQASAGKLAPSSQQFARLAFSEAADRYLDSRRLELTARSLKKERQLLVEPRRFFGATPLSRITTEALLAYRESRAKGVGPAYVNMEMGAIRRILKRAKRWHLVGADVKPLRERREIGRAAIPRGESAAAPRGSQQAGVASGPACYDFGPEHDDAGLRTERAALARRRPHRMHSDRPAQ